jgi:hypothetical protein
MKTPDEIYLIYMGPETGLVWCDSPAPGIEMDEEDSIKYVRVNKTDSNHKLLSSQSKPCLQRS